MPELLRAKVCVLGEAAVGKTSLVRRFLFDEYSDRYLPTLGAKVVKKEVDARIASHDVHVVLAVWDIMGVPTFRDLLKGAYFHGVQGVLAVADLTRPATIHALPAWVDAARSVSGPVPVVLLGNKADLAAAEGAQDTLAELAESFQASSFRTSAKTGMDVEPAFAKLAGLVGEAALSQGKRRPPGTAGGLVVEGSP